MANILYKIYYGSECIYFGRTHQDLKDRIRAHVFNNKKGTGTRIKHININNISKIEFVECKSEADMFLYEIYYINKIKPKFNTDDKAVDNLSITLPDLTFNVWTCSSWEEWKTKINAQEAKKECDMKFEEGIDSEKNMLEMMLRHGDITQEEYNKKMNAIEMQIAERQYKQGKINLFELMKITGKSQL